MDCRSKVASSNLAVNAIQFACFTETGGHSSRDHKHEHFNRGGAGAARGAHNSEVIGSKPISGISGFVEAAKRCTCASHFCMTLIWSGSMTLKRVEMDPAGCNLFHRFHSVEIGA